MKVAVAFQHFISPHAIRSVFVGIAHSAKQHATAESRLTLCKVGGGTINGQFAQDLGHIK